MAATASSYRLEMKDGKINIENICLQKLRTQHKAPHGIVIHEWPRQCTLGQISTQQIPNAWTSVSGVSA
jgi:hypothetical protein